MRLYDYSNLVIDKDNGIVFSGISYFPVVSQIIGDNIVYTTEILPEENYRPDKIADRIWGVPELNWVLDILNDFQNGIQEYKMNIIIQYVSLESLKKIGII